MESPVIFRGVKTIMWLWPWGSNPIHSHGILDHDMHHNKGKWFSCLIQVCISNYSYQHILMTETHTSSDVVLSCGRCGVGGERDWGGVWGGNRSGITLLVVLWRGDCTLAVNRNKTTSLKPRLCNVLPISMCSTHYFPFGLELPPWAAAKPGATMKKSRKMAFMLLNVHGGGMTY